MQASKVAQLVMISWVLAGVILYLMGSFVAANLNVMEWDGFGRFILVLLWFCGSCMTTIGGVAHFLDEQEKQGRLEGITNRKPRY